MESQDPVSGDTQAVIMAALSTLPPHHLLRLTQSLFSDLRSHHRRLATLLSSPSLFSLTILRLRSLPLPSKALLLARHLLSALRRLTHFSHPAPSVAAPALCLRDYDAVLLLLLLCEVHHRCPDALRARPSEWRLILCRFFSATLLSVSGVSGAAGLIPLAADAVTRCRRLLDAMGPKTGREPAASPAAVVALPSVEIAGDGVECAVCREEMEEGRDVCELPCGHVFHWMCILPWLRQRSTCPCCRLRLPTDDVFGEIGRLWDVLVRVGGGKAEGERT